MAMEALVANAPSLKSAIVTLDVLHSGVIWGWYVTMNMWAKSIGTGVMLVGLYMMRKYQTNLGFFRTAIPLLGLIFIGITLLFTLLDLHQPLRFWHMFVWPHLTSVINWGSTFLNLYVAVLIGLFYALIKSKDELYNKLLLPAGVIAFIATIYTAGLMGQANAREIWQTPTEVAQMLLAATLAGSAAFLIVGFTLTEEEKISLGYVLAVSALIAFVIFLAEIVFAPQKSEEAEWVIHYITSGGMGLFFAAGLLLAFVIPMVTIALGIKNNNTSKFRLAALSALVGLWMVKHAWLIAPQMIPLS
ncbi:MAG: polysulfide reductase NrfD [Campylobacterales bacterium]